MYLELFYKCLFVYVCIYMYTVDSSALPQDVTSLSVPICKSNTPIFWIGWISVNQPTVLCIYIYIYLIYLYLYLYLSIYQSISGSYIGQIISGKGVGAQNWRCPNRDIKFSKSRNNW